MLRRQQRPFTPHSAARQGTRFAGGDSDCDGSDDSDDGHRPAFGVDPEDGSDEVSPRSKDKAPPVRGPPAAAESRLACVRVRVRMLVCVCVHACRCAYHARPMWQTLRAHPWLLAACRGLTAWSSSRARYQWRAPHLHNQRRGHGRAVRSRCQARLTRLQARWILVGAPTRAASTAAGGFNCKSFVGHVHHMCITWQRHSSHVTVSLQLMNLLVC